MVPSLAGLGQEQRALAEGRWQVLRPHVQDGVPLARVACDAQVPLRTAQRWLVRYRAGGLAALARPSRSDRGVRRTPQELVRLVEGLALRRPRPSVATVARQAALAAAENGWPAPSYSTVHAIVNGLDPQLVTLAHDGPTALRDRYELVHRRQSDRPNALWQADHTELDLLVLDADGTPAGPWLSVVLDDCSRAVRLQPVPGGAFHAEPVAGPAPGHLAQDRPHLGGAQPARRAVRRPRQRLHQRPPRSSHRRPAHRAGAQRRRPPAGPRQDRAVLRHRHHRTAAPAARATRPRPPGVPCSAHAARGGRRPRSVDHRQLPPAHPRRDRPGAAAGLGRRRLAAPHPRTASSSSTCRSSRSPSRGSCTATASAFKACATSTRPWPPTSASQSPSATTRGTSARSECSTATGSCAGDQPRARRPDTDAVGRITRGNFRLVHRLFVQIERVLRINDLTVITSDVIGAARRTLVIGDT